MGFPDLRRRVPLAKASQRLALLLLAANIPTSALHAQSPQPGTTLPVRLLRSLNSDKDAAGKTFEVKTTQAIPLLGRQVIRKGTRIMGHIVSTQTLDSGNRLPQLTVQFDKLVYSSNKQVPIVVALRAIASFVAVAEAESPTNDPDMGPANWNTQQIGGDVVYRGGGPVTTNMGEVVGKPVPDGVIAKLIAPPAGTYPNNLHCTSDENLHALGLFGSSACGVYGFSHLSIAKDGFTEPKGQIVIASSARSVKVASGSQLLLQVVGQ